MPQCVGPECGQGTGEERGVGDHVRKLFRQAQNDRVATGPEVVQGGAQCLVEVDRAEVEVKGPGMQTAQIVEIGDQLRRPVHGRPGRVQKPRLLGNRLAGTPTPQALERLLGGVQGRAQIAACCQEQ